jgi:hypothetical protein
VRFQLGLMMVLGAMAATAGKPPASSCTNMAGTFTFDDANARIRSDGRGTYQDGVDGVIVTLFQCGSGDAVLNLALNPASRTLILDFQGNRLDSADPQPSWLGNSITALAILNVRNLVVGYDAASGNWSNAATLATGCISRQPCTFTTTLGSSFQAPDRREYNLKMVNPDATYGPDPGTSPDLFNANYMTSKVRVTFMPGAVPSGDTWVAEPETSPSYAGWVSALGHTTGKKVTRMGNYDHYFKLTITRK